MGAVYCWKNNAESTPKCSTPSETTLQADDEQLGKSSCASCNMYPLFASELKLLGQLIGALACTMHKVLSKHNTKDTLLIFVSNS